jgi:hypothetical protein
MSSGVDLFNQFSQTVAESLAEGLDQIAAAIRPPSPKPRKDECKRDMCHCKCCICDADLVVYARLGERRVIPIVLENSRRRERQIRVELSRWTTHGGKRATIASQILPPTEFALPPCAEHQVVILVDTMDKDDSGREEGKLPDVDECEVLYADLRLEGCGIRPIRIALALLPRDCYAYEADCRCVCC